MIGATGFRRQALKQGRKFVTKINMIEEYDPPTISLGDRLLILGVWFLVMVAAGTLFLVR